MGDALIVGRGGSSGGSSGKTLVTKIIQATQSWAVPKAKDQKFYVRIFGGGGGGGMASAPTSASDFAAYAGGGGGGFMNNAELTLEAGTSIPITIGVGGKITLANGGTGGTGGTTSFGTYLAANGGYGGGHTGGGSINTGGDGGSGGGGSGSTYGYGGTGYQFGGGSQANGGKWGGAGGGDNKVSKKDSMHYCYGGCLYYDNGVMQKDSDGNPILSGLAGNAGENGVSTIGNNQIPNGTEDRPYYELNLQGGGLTSKYGVNDSYIGVGYYITGAGGGYGGNAGNTCLGGGGGYGANGGDGEPESPKDYKCDEGAGGGGGGYGGDGGDGCNIKVGNVCYLSGGGGGYGPSGVGGSQSLGYPDGGIAAGGAGGSFNFYKKNSTTNINLYNNYCPAGKGGNGICIIQYYA